MGINFINNSKEVLQALQQQAEVALEACGLAGEGFAKENITRQGAVDTGNLRNSIAHKVDPQERCVYIGTNVHYAPYIEYGTGIYYEGGRRTSWTYQDANGDWHRTKGMVPRPYLKPAAADHGKEYKQIIKQYLQDK